MFISADPNILLPIGLVLGGVMLLFINSVIIFYLFKVDIVLGFRSVFPVLYPNKGTISHQVCRNVSCINTYSFYVIKYNNIVTISYSDENVDKADSTLSVHTAVSRIYSRKTLLQYNIPVTLKSVSVKPKPQWKNPP